MRLSPLEARAADVLRERGPLSSARLADLIDAPTAKAAQAVVDRLRKKGFAVSLGPGGYMLDGGADYQVKRWSNEDDERLIKAHGRGEEWDSIARALGRSISMCQRRLSVLNAIERMKDSDAWFSAKRRELWARDDGRRVFVEPPRVKRASTVDPYAAIYAKALSEVGL